MDLSSMLSDEVLQDGNSLTDLRVVGLLREEPPVPSRPRRWRWGGPARPAGCRHDEHDGEARAPSASSAGRPAHAPRPEVGEVGIEPVVDEPMPQVPDQYPETTKNTSTPMFPPA